MPIRVRKSVKIMPGVRLTFGSKGVSSLSVRGKGGSVSLGRKGVTSSTRILPGMSYVRHTPYQGKTAPQAPPPREPMGLAEKVFWLALGCLIAAGFWLYGGLV